MVRELSCARKRESLRCPPRSFVRPSGTTKAANRPTNTHCAPSIRRQASGDGAPLSSATTRSRLGHGASDRWTIQTSRTSESRTTRSTRGAPYVMAPRRNCGGCARSLPIILGGHEGGGIRNRLRQPEGTRPSTDRAAHPDTKHGHDRRRTRIPDRPSCASWGRPAVDPDLPK